MIFLDFSGLPFSPVIIEDCSLEDVHGTIENFTKLNREYYYITHEGLPIYDDGLNSCDLSGEICVVPRLLGGKGGFGSMLRAIGAQIEKTTNREACRDLSGRRLRDINEEQRLKTWISQQSDREREAEERKRIKLQKLSAEPKHEFHDEQYQQSRSELTDKLFESVEQGIQASSSSKRTNDSDDKPKKKIKKFLKCEEEDLLSSSDESLEETHNKPQINIEMRSDTIANEDFPKSNALVKPGI